MDELLNSGSVEVPDVFGGDDEDLANLGGNEALNLLEDPTLDHGVILTQWRGYAESVHSSYCKGWLTGTSGAQFARDQVEQRSEGSGNQGERNERPSGNAGLFPVPDHPNARQ